MDVRFSKYPAHYTTLIIFFIGFVNGFYIDWIYQTNIVAVWAYDVLQFVILPFALFFILYRYHNIRPSDYGIIIPATEKHSLIIPSIYCAVILCFFWLATYELINSFVPDVPQVGYVNMIPEGLLRYPVILYMSATAAVVEEIAYRGIPLLLFNKFIDRKHFNLLFAVITAVVFALVHWENGVADLSAAFVFGLFSAMLYLHYRNLTPIIIAHFVTDIVIFW